MQKVTIELEQRWSFTPSPPREGVDAVIECTPEFLEDWERVSKQYNELQELLEHCYRRQQGLTPWENSPFAPR